MEVRFLPQRARLMNSKGSQVTPAAGLEGAASPLTALARSSPEEYSGVGDY